MRLAAEFTFGKSTLLTAISIENKLNHTIDTTPLADHLFAFGVDAEIVEAVRLLEVQNPMLILANRDCIDHYDSLRNEFAIALQALKQLEDNPIAKAALEELSK